jgi:hypothetical protein
LEFCWTSVFEPMTQPRQDKEKQTIQSLSMGFVIKTEKPHIWWP